MSSQWGFSQSSPGKPLARLLGLPFSPPNTSKGVLLPAFGGVQGLVAGRRIVGLVVLGPLVAIPRLALVGGGVIFAALVTAEVVGVKGRTTMVVADFPQLLRVLLLVVVGRHHFQVAPGFPDFRRSSAIQVVAGSGLGRWCWFVVWWA